MKNILFKIYLNLIKFALQFTKTDSNSYVVLNGAGRSGSNGYLFYKYLKEEHPEIKSTLVEPFPTSHLSWSTWKTIAEAKYLFATHDPFKIKKSQVVVQFWHGIPLKRMGLLAKNTNSHDDLKMMKHWLNTVDVLTSSSALYEALMTSAVGVRDNTYQRLGFPRTDALYSKEVKPSKLLTDLFETTDTEAKIGIYMPTFRWELDRPEVMEQISSGNFFAFSDFDVDALNETLKQKHTYLIVKLHPYEQNRVSLTGKYSNIYFLENDYLFDNDLDLYNLLPATDFLITDYSSIYFDYLHLNKPIYFVDNYLDDYLTARGILIDPYEEITPGAKVKTQAELIDAIYSVDEYESERNKWLEMTYSITKDKNNDRIFNYLQNKANK